MAIAVAALLHDRGVDCIALQDVGALERTIDQFHPQIVVLDYRLKETTGREVHRIIRQRWPILPILLMSAERPNVDDLMREPRTRFIAKPFDGDDLMKTIHEMLAAG